MNKYTQLFTKLLDAKDFNYETHEATDASFVTFPYKGKSIACIFSGDNGEYFSLYLSYEQIPEDKYADVLILCNELNSTYKWVKFYIDKENNFCLDNDAILSEATAAEEAFELLVRLINISDEVKAPLMKAIYA